MAIRRIVSRRGSFDSSLGQPRRQDNRNDLTLTVKIHLRRMTPPGNRASHHIWDSGTRYEYVPWQDRVWADYRRRFESMCEMIWNDELYLTLPANTPADVVTALTSQEPGASTKAPYIRCHMDVQISDSVSNSHASLRCYNLAESAPDFRSYISPSRGRDTGIMTDRDIYLEFYNNGGHDRFFSTVAHEVGHILGLNHPVCSTNSNACYGTPNTAAYGEVMGFGTNVGVRQAIPWQNRIQAHTAVRHRWPPTTTQPNQPTIEELLSAYASAPAATASP